MPLFCHLTNLHFYNSFLCALLYDLYNILMVDSDLPPMVLFFFQIYKVGEKELERFTQALKFCFFVAIQFAPCKVSGLSRNIFIFN